MKLARMFRTALLCGILVILAAGSVRAQSDGPPRNVYDERMVKAAFIYNFAKFTDWPQEAFESADSPLRVCVLGTNTLGTAISTIVGKTVKTRPVVASQIPDAKLSAGCHVIFVSKTKRSELPAILDVLHARPLLLISDMPNFARLGGTINLYKRKSRLRFKINLEAAGKAGLRLSSKMLKLGEIVTTQAAGR